MALNHHVKSCSFRRRRAFGRSLDGRRRPAWKALLRCVVAGLVMLPFFTRSDVEAKLTVEDYAIIGEALHATEMDEWQRAFRLMGSIDDQLANKLFRWLTMLEGENDPDFGTLSTFIIENPDWPRIAELQRMAEARLTDSADKRLTSELFALKKPLTTRGRIRHAEALIENGRTEEAAKEIRRAWIDGTFSAQEEQRFLERHRRHLRPGDHNARLEQLLWDRRWRDANRMFERVSDAYARLAKARIALQTQSPGVDQAIGAVPAELLNDPGLLFDRARWRRLKRKHSDAKELLLNPPARLVRPERWWFERAYHVRRSIEARAFEEAYQLASKHRQRSGGDYAEAEWLSGWLALRFINRPKSAFRHFVRLYDRVSAPVRQARAAYWAGRAAASQKDEAGAVAWYRRAAMHNASYYGQLALLELREDRVDSLPPEPTETERTAFEAKELTAVARMLIAAGNGRYLDEFLAELGVHAESSAEIGMIADYAKAAGRPTLLARLGRSAAFDGKVHVSTAFPIPKIEGLLEPEASVAPALLLGVARQESMFRSEAKSPAGARGLLQLIPSTARIVSKQTGVDYDQERLVADPDYNAFLGGHYLASLIERFEGAVPLALAGYNAGPLRVSRWMELHGDPREGDPYAMVDWIELIPFGETRNYVQRVLEGHGVYKRRLAETDVEMIDYPGINLLHPPPVPVARPADLANAVVRSTTEESQEIAAHRPELKPLDHSSVTVVRRNFDDDGEQDVVADEGEGELLEAAGGSSL